MSSFENLPFKTHDSSATYMPFETVQAVEEARNHENLKAYDNIKQLLEECDE